MKLTVKFMCIAFALLMCLGSFAACGKQNPVTDSDTGEGTSLETGSDTLGETQKETEAGTDPVVPEKYSETIYDMTEAGAFYKQLGRSYQKDGVLYCDYTLSGFEMTADCRGDILLTAEADNVRFEIAVDGKVTEHYVLSKGTHKIATGLSEGPHTIRIINEEYKKAAIKSITLAGELTKTAETATYIEFVGDSITSGCGLFDGSTAADDATSAWAYLAAGIMATDYNSLGISGMSIAYDPSNTVNNKYSVNDRAVDGKYAPYRTADLVVVNLGTNDNYQWFSGKRQLPDGAVDNSKPANSNSTEGFYSYEGFDKAFAKLISDIETANGADTPILFVFGCMENKAYTVGTDRAKKLIAEKVATGENWRTVTLTTDRSGYASHPAKDGARRQAQELAEFVTANYADLGFKMVAPLDIPEIIPTVPERVESTGSLALDFNSDRDFKTYMAFEAQNGISLPTGKKNGEIVGGVYHNTGNECFFEDLTRMMYGGADTGEAFAYTITFKIQFESFSPSANHTVFNLHGYKTDMTIANWNKLLAVDPDGKLHIATKSQCVMAELNTWYDVKITVDVAGGTAALMIGDADCGSIAIGMSTESGRCGFRFGNGGGAKFYVDDFSVIKN